MSARTIRVKISDEAALQIATRLSASGANAEAACVEVLLADRQALTEALGWVRALAEDERLHEEVSEERFGVEGCEACDVIAAIDKALAEAGIET